MNGKRKTITILFASVLVVLFVVIAMINIFGKKEYVVGKDIKADDITEFYDTYYNMNFNALYQRYYFYVKDGKHYFYHEKRERKNDYCPLDEKDITESGTIELSDEEWDTFFEYIKDGTVIAREESADTGDSGPWYYLYWNKDKGNIQQFSFVSYEKKNEFEQFCRSLKGNS